MAGKYDKFPRRSAVGGRTVRKIGRQKRHGSPSSWQNPASGIQLGNAVLVEHNSQLSGAGQPQQKLNDWLSYSGIKELPEFYHVKNFKDEIPVVLQNENTLGQIQQDGRLTDSGTGNLSAFTDDQSVKGRKSPRSVIPD
ncbi:hypothetical protein WN51_06683 [Melipona quadrifasciata]|uniref:Uncharacterized protein n=1 Tax=Melipona quadrifasciata TaxID=166423 RepID=A0A0N0U7D5_9HYME|nr:hypothetical protein WN51_06683 [Melipona quadrifasciata]